MKNEQIVLITGTSRGLGKNLSTQLSKGLYTIYNGVRDLSTAPKHGIPIKIDLANDESLVQAVDQIIKEKGRLDILIHNAGTAYAGPVDSMTLLEAKNMFETNFFGPFRLTQLVLPFMRSQHSGRIVFISSIRGIESCAYMGMYSASKSAIEAIAFDWACVLEKWNIKVSVVEPGPTATGIDIKHGSHFFNEENPYFPYPEVDLEWKPMEEISKEIVRHIKQKAPPFRFQPCEFSKKTVQKHLRDPSGENWLQEQKQALSICSILENSPN